MGKWSENLKLLSIFIVRFLGAEGTFGALFTFFVGSGYLNYSNYTNYPFNYDVRPGVDCSKELLFNFKILLDIGVCVSYAKFILIINDQFIWCYYNYEKILNKVTMLIIKISTTRSFFIFVFINK